MEDTLVPPPLAPSTSPIAAAVLTRRRSHLDSGSYRTLSRLFHCFHLHHSLSDGSPPPEAKITAANPTGVDSGDSPQVPKDADFDRQPEALENEAEAAGSPSRRVTCSPARDQPTVPNATNNPGEAKAPQVALDDMDVLLESSCAEPCAVSEKPVIEARLVVEGEALKSAKACLEGEDDKSVEEAMGNNNEHLLLDAMMTNFAGLIDDIGVGPTLMPTQNCGVSEGELQNSKDSEEPKQLSSGTEEEIPASNSDHRHVDDGGFEEGEIEGELQDLGAEESDSEPADENADDEEPRGDSICAGSGAIESCSQEMRCRNAHLKPENKGTDDLVLDKDVNIRNDGQLYDNRAQAVSYSEVLDWNETPLPNNKDTKPGKKRKRHLTEERKAKKTKNKRMNRAQKRIAEGVHKLRLQPVIKPRIVKPCHFYNHGKCQQGDSCKFSHDFIPSTKSKPCKHFATGSCLKGDDCPYDHELSKYPCHKYESGMCFRGDKCKFSHVLATTEGTSTTDAKKSDVSLASEKTNLTEQTSSQKTSTVHNGEPVIHAPPKQQNSILKNLAGISINSQNATTRIPKGVQFLPFSRSGSNSSSTHQDSLSIEKDRNANSGENQCLGGRQATEQKVLKENEQRPFTLLDEKNTSKGATLPTPCAATPGPINTQHEVSVASRILQEFLFGASS